jgi:hypothetical protein
MTNEYYPQEVSIDLTDEEKIEYGEIAAKLNLEIDVLTLKQKESNDGFKRKIKEKELSRAEFLKSLNRGKKQVVQDCIVQKNYEKNQWEFINRDGELVKIETHEGDPAVFRQMSVYDLLEKQDPIISTTTIDESGNVSSNLNNEDGNIKEEIGGDVDGRIEDKN